MQVSFGKRVTRSGRVVPIIVNVWSFVSTLILSSSRTCIACSRLDKLSNPSLALSFIKELGSVVVLSDFSCSNFS